MENDKGFIKLSRKFFSNELWNEARTFSSCEAWLDLIQSARFEATPRKVSIGGREVICNRGQYPASIRFLAKRWNWTERKVRTFISFLKKREMISTECVQGVNIITLCKYEEYNRSDTVSDTTNDTGIMKIINDLQSKVTQLTAQQVTQLPKKRHTGDTNTKKEEEIKKKALSNESEKEKFLSSLSCETKDYKNFVDWLIRNAPYCFVHMKLPTEKEMGKLKSKYSGKELSEIVEKIENRSDLRKKYVNLYRTVLDWSKREYGS